ncbi:hypothetical protein OQA88_6729 [Cercophora sp. LCS_1]
MDDQDMSKRPQKKKATGKKKKGSGSGSGTPATQAGSASASASGIATSGGVSVGGGHKKTGSSGSVGILRIVDANVGTSGERPRTTAGDVREEEKENEGLGTPPRRKVSAKKTPGTPESKIARPKGTPEVNGEEKKERRVKERKEEKRFDEEDVKEERGGENGENTTDMTKIEAVERQVTLVDSPADTQEDLSGLPATKTNGKSLKPTTTTTTTKAPVTEHDEKALDYDDYPDLSIDENDRESRAREQRYYRAYRVRFAPWNIPFKRRLQTLAVLMHSLSIASTVSFFFFLCAIPLTWPILIPYLLHMLLSKAATDGRLRFRSERFRRAPVWKFFADYFPARLHKTHELPPTRKYIFGYHPHGIISHGAFASFATEALGFDEKFPGITNSLLTLDSNFRIPLYREYILSLGIQSVSKESITNILTRGGRNGEGMGRAVTIVVGGARESLEAHPGTMHLILGERKGFVKLAVRTGADLVPVLAFGENDLYDQVSPKTHPSLHRLQMWVLRTLKFTLPFLHGRGIFNYDVGLMPYRRPLNVVVGKPIKVTQARGGEVDMQEVERLHGEYVRELKKMWERYKDVFAVEREEEMVLLN